MAVVAASVVTIGFSLPAFADPCYTGCAPSPISIVGGGPSISPGVPGPHTPVPPPTESVPPPGGLPFTGQDVEQIVGIAVVLLIGGVVMIRLGRRKGRHALTS
jgi:hypothetical protein